MNKNRLLVLGVLLILSFTPGIPAVPPYKNPHLPIDKRVADLLSRMTLEEKIRQLDMYWGKEVANMGKHEAESWSEEMTAANPGSVGALPMAVLYVRDEESSVTTPERALKGFSRVVLQPGEEKLVTFKLEVKTRGKLTAGPGKDNKK